MLTAETLGRRGAGDGGGSAGGSAWQQELRQRAGRAALVSAQRRGCLHLFWQVGPMSAQLNLQLSTARRVSACERAPRGAQDPCNFFAGPQPARQRPLLPESPAPAPPLHAPWRHWEGRPASPDGMSAAMLPYACVLVLLGGRCHRSPTGSMPEVGREGARHLTFSKGPWELLHGPVHRVSDAAS